MDDLAACIITASLSCESSNEAFSDGTCSSSSSSTTSAHHHHSLASHLHPKFVDLYKKRSHLSSQEERRRAILNEQKKKRQSAIDVNRVETQSGENKRDENEKSSTKKSSSSLQTSKYIERMAQQFSNKLMYSEWLEEVPTDFDHNWIMVMCPVGKRCLVVASEGTTSVYNKAGKMIARHSSLLPGGCHDSKIDETILDCVYNDYLRTYFILDCLCWKSHPTVETETEFRFFWIKCKLDEMPRLKDWSNDNPYAFKDVDRVFPLNSQTISYQLEISFNNQPKIDGLLFYHKETHYTAGFTPLVGWLKAYMLPEILHLPVPAKIIESAPSDYHTAKQTIEIDKSRSLDLINSIKTKQTVGLINSGNEEIQSDDMITT